MLTLYIDAKLVSEANRRDHWALKAKRVASHRDAVSMAWLLAGKPTIDPPCVVTITRVAPRQIRDSDNLVISAKALRDQLAEDVLRCDDGDPRVRWEYGQRRGKTGEYAVEVTFAETRREAA